MPKYYAKRSLRPLPDDAEKGLRKRGNVWYLSFTPLRGEKQRHVCLRTADKAEAIEKAQRIRQRPAEIGVGSWGTELRHYIDYRTDAGRMTSGTARSVQEVVELFAKYGVTHHKRTSPGEIQQKDVYDFIFKELVGLKHSTISTYHARLSAFFNYLVEVGTVETNYFAEISIRPIPAAHLARDKWIDKKQIKKLIESAGDHELRFILYAGFHAGMRKREIVMSRPHWFDLQQMRITVPHEEETTTENGTYHFTTKSKRSRSIPMSSEFRLFLRPRFRRYKRQVFMLEKKGKGYGKRYRYDFRRPLEDFFRAQGLENFSSHLMRHSFASNCVMAGKSLFQVAQWLGNRERTAETHYAHLKTGKDDLKSVF